MSIKRPLASAAFLVCLAVATVAAPSVALAGTATPSLATTTFPQTASAQQGATWLARQLTPSGYLLSTTSPGQPDLVATANVVLALASAGVDRRGAEAALIYLESHVGAYVTVSGSD